MKIKVEFEQEIPNDISDEDINAIELDPKAADALNKLGLDPTLHVFKQFRCNACGNIFEIRE